MRGRIQAQIGDDPIADIPLAPLTSWRVGGPAAWMIRPSSAAALAERLRRGVTEPLDWLGLGSNVLVSDHGFPGTIILTHGGLDQLQAIDDRRITVEAGVPCARLARFSIRAGLAGGEFFAGIPGTLGGALAMNAGAFGGVTWERVESVTTLDRQGTLRHRPASDFRPGYRQVDGPAGEWFAAAVLRFPEASPGQDGRDEVRRLLAHRAATQPITRWTCGSVFRNPPGDYAGRLIEAAGLMGYRDGDASVSRKHANFIINHGRATATQIQRVIDTIQHRVEARFGVALIPEVRTLGA
jgi:UDP-N-acetylmuramate dehydrogenase